MVGEGYLATGALILQRRLEGEHILNLFKCRCEISLFDVLLIWICRLSEFFQFIKQNLEVLDPVHPVHNPGVLWHDGLVRLCPSAPRWHGLALRRDERVLYGVSHGVIIQRRLYPSVEYCIEELTVILIDFLFLAHGPLIFDHGTRRQPVSLPMRSELDGLGLDLRGHQQLRPGLYLHLNIIFILIEL